MSRFWNSSPYPAWIRLSQAFSSLLSHGCSFQPDGTGDMLPAVLDCHAVGLANGDKRLQVLVKNV